MHHSRAWVVQAAAAAAAALTACSTSGSPSALSPQGPAALRIEGLWWFMFWIASAVFCVVIGMLLYGIFRRRKADPVDKRGADTAVILLGIVAPTIILVTVFVVSLRDLDALSSPAKTDAMVVDVIGHDWWWEVRYPDEQIETANEIHIPTGRPVLLHVSTGDVIHSFWVPQLSQKMDMIPGKVNRLLIQADRSGIYRGQCAEFCGLEHARMSFLVIAEPPSKFESWAANESQPIATGAGSAARGEQVFLNSTCISCHAIQGTTAHATDGPDLTHFGSRRTIAANTVPNTRGHLTAWIADPQSIKPGALMPPSVLEPDQLQDVVTFLEGLE